MKKHLPTQNQQFEEIRSLIELRRNRAYQAVNTETIFTYWEIGKYVSQKLKSQEWGSKVVDSLSLYLKEKEPTMKGVGRRGIYRMVQFYDTYTDTKFVSAMLTQLQSRSKNEIVSALPLQLQQPENKDVTFVGALRPQIVAAMLRQLQSRSKREIVSALPLQFQSSENEAVFVSFLAQITWTAHLEILSGCTDAYERLFYMLSTISERWTYRTLRRQIEASTYERTLIGNNKQSQALKELTLPLKATLRTATWLIS